ncbi:MAG: TIM barrel protein [Prolixibacteraceae bacterium]|jgi:hydroxypyruvate isomerase|nr:TIM barrel protein [Prolixibacteraceae bacterium]MBT6007015.1 TIM barrel protein [Prolixibacteraceae bacterium]MBT6763182.1 TIM barrel protein [Prolixibacteraceae bacterium]MBT6996949.1 TIM barrel protein [Prolixibacteraceae bacterium]MBT7397001.1 TIM barrel protein [Prolixibacteraceae bacterium]
MKRRNFIKSTAASGIALSGLTGIMGASASGSKVSNSAKFNLKYAPNLGMFREHAGRDPIDNIKFIADQGFRAIFDNGLMNKPPELQEKIANELARLDMDLGPFVLYADFKVKSMVTQDPEIKEMLKKKMADGLEVQKRTGIKTALVVPGRFDDALEWDYQTANVIDNMRMCCDIVGESGLKLVMEPLNAWTNHPGLFLTKMPQAHMICVAVNHPSCKIVDDIYHQQITEGNIIPNIDMCWDSIGAFHIGDNPGRKEPTTGEINYKNIFKHIYDKGYDGVLCAEHGKSISGKEGELALINAYREVDAFEV